jgi:hypothetical protein
MVHGGRWEDDSMICNWRDVQSASQERVERYIAEADAWRLAQRAAPIVPAHVAVRQSLAAAVRRLVAARVRRTLAPAAR